MSRYDDALRSWTAKRERGITDADIPEVNYIFSKHLVPAIQSADPKGWETIEKILRDFSIVLSSSGESGEGAAGTVRHKGTNTFLNYLYTQVFQDLHRQYQAANQEIVRGRRKPSSRDWARIRILQLPNRFFSNWITRYVPDITVPQETLKIGERQKLTPEVKRQFEKPATIKSRKPRVPKSELPISPADGGPFKVNEPLIVARYQDWPSKFLMFQPLRDGIDMSGGNDGLGKMVYYTQDMLNSLAKNDQLPRRLDDLILLHQQARFWVEEFFNFIVAPCDFANPTDLQIDQAYSKYRTQVMVPLIKLALFTLNQAAIDPLRQASLEETGSDDVYQALMNPIMHMNEWREYISVHFPDAARILFEEYPSVDAQRFYQKYDQIIPTLRRIQELFVGPAPPVRPQKKRLTFPLSRPPKRRQEDEGEKVQEEVNMEEVEFVDLDEVDEIFQ